MQISLFTTGTNNIERWLASKSQGDGADGAFLRSMGSKGVSALSANTPKRTGGVASSWNYRVMKDGTGWTLEWYNSAYPSLSVNVALLLQYGHGTRNRGYVAGRDYINPAMAPILEAISAYFMKGD